MSREISRRAVLKGAAAATVGVATAMNTSAAPSISPEQTKDDPRFSAEVKKLLPAALASVETNHKNRLFHKLPENSEPCTVYTVTAYSPTPRKAKGGK